MNVIQLVKERYQALGTSTGAIGIILEVYGDEGYQVEFTSEDGVTIAWFAWGSATRVYIDVLHLWGSIPRHREVLM